MLVEFRVDNHRSIRDEQALSMEASLPEDGEDARPRTMPGHSKKLLTVAAIYGANASGKTNLLHALDFMRNAVVDSHRSWAPNEGIARRPFAWRGKRDEPSEFVVSLFIDRIRFEYGFTANDDAFLEEWLFAWPQGRKQVWFERDGADFTFGDSLQGENRAIQKITRPNSLFLSAAIQNSHEQLHPLYDWFQGMRSQNLSPHRRHRVSQYAIARIFDDKRPMSKLRRKGYAEIATAFRQLLQQADFGIVDVKVVNVLDEYDGKTIELPRLMFHHDAADPNAWLAFDDQSRGTQTLFAMALPMLEALQLGSFLVVDELEASLHPLLAAQIVKLFNDPITNPKHAQLVFSTHDTNLLGTSLGDSLMRRDQVWFTEKDTHGATIVYPLTDYMPRKAENLERGYLQGRYGAVPFLGELRFAEETD